MINKMLNKKEFKSVVFTIFFMLNSVLIFAQDTEDGPEGPPTGSIDALLFPMVLLAILFGALVFYKKNALNYAIQ
jgi:hypothetical protein